MTDDERLTAAVNVFATVFTREKHLSGDDRLKEAYRAARRTDAAEFRTGDVADPHGNGCKSIGSGGLFNREWAAPGNDAHGRHRAHRFPPGPAAITEWDGPQPAIRRGDDGVPGRSHRLRLLGNSVVPQQAALAWRTLSARAADRRAA